MSLSLIRRHAAALLLAGVALAAPAVAHADWEWTRWGMTVDSVVAGSGGAVSRVEGRPGDRVHDFDLKATGEIVRYGIRLNAQFYFDPAGASLKVIRLSVIDFADCDRLKQAVRRDLGAPDSPGSFLEWRNDGRGNYVGVTGVKIGATDGICFVRYRPVADGSGTP